MAERGLFASTFDEFAFIRGILKMQMTEQSPVSEHGAFRHGLHRDEYGEGIGGTGIASVEHIAGFAFQPLVVHMIEPIFMTNRITTVFEIPGRVMCHAFWNRFAPSSSAAS